MTRLDHRVGRLEARANRGAKAGRGAFEIWIELADGRMRGEDGKILSPEEFERRPFRADTILVMPDNGRDGPLPTISAGRTSR